MIDYIIKNTEWIFSGAGVSAILIVGGWLFRNSKPKAPADKSNIPVVVHLEATKAQPSPEKNIHPHSEVTSIVKRFNQILDLMNEKRHYSKYTIAALAQLMKLHSVGELESVFLGSREPSFEFIDHFCETFGVNRHWLIEGKESPFSNSDRTHYDPLDYLNEIKTLSPNRLYFIRSASEVGEVFLLLKFSDHKYKIISRVWHISDHVGGGGRSQIFGMYQLILTLKNSQFSLSCGGRVLREVDFKKLLNGEVFPGSIIDFPAQENPWWDDFIDVHHKHPISSDYESSYGYGFMAAQSIVRSKLAEIEEHQSA